MSPQIAHPPFELGTVPTLRETLGYLAKHRGETFVVKISSKLIGSSVLSSIIRDLAALHRIGIRVVIVAGTTSQIDAELKLVGSESKVVDGFRITTDESISTATAAAASNCNQIMMRFAESGINALIGNWVKARGVGVLRGTDFQSTGVVQSISTDILRTLLEQSFVPIVPNIGWSAAGKPYYICANKLATSLAMRLGASKLFFVSSTVTVPRDLVIPTDITVRENGVIESLTLKQATDLMSANLSVIATEYTDYIDCGRCACGYGVSRTHIVDGLTDGSILSEVFSQDGIGTMIYADEYANIRQATDADIADILRIQEPYVKQGILIPRTADQIAAKIVDYAVYEVDGFIHGCAALHPFSDGSVEIAGIAVSEHYRKWGVGRKLVQFWMKKSIAYGYFKLFLLTTQTSDWFVDLGFAKGTVADLPEEKASEYNPARASQIFVKDLKK